MTVRATDNPNTNAIVTTGELLIDIKELDINANWYAIKCEKSLSIENSDKTTIQSSNIAIYIDSDEPKISIKKSDVTVHAYGMNAVKSNTEISANFEDSSVFFISNKHAFTNGWSESTLNGLFLYGKQKNDDAMISITPSQVNKYSNVQISKINLTKDLTKEFFTVVVIVISALIFLFVLRMLVRKKRREARLRMLEMERLRSLSADMGAAPRSDEPAVAASTVPADTLASDKQAVEPIAEKTKAAETSPVRSNKDSVDIATLSRVPGESFALSVDGHVVGYIGPQRGHLMVPGGMHEVAVISNDVQRKEVFKQNMILRQGTEFTVEKKIGGRKVIIK